MRPGDVLAGRFALEAHAGAGGMAEVYRARDLERGCAVAIKLLRDTSGADAPRFQREATLLAELEHPRIVRHVTHGSLPSGALYLAMEWLEGEDLSRRLARGRLEVQEAVEIARCVAEALGAAHARGIVHRDLKPSNVFLAGAEPPRDVRLLDFGIAWPCAGTRMTGSGVLIGTPAYMAPEQARSGGVVDARADVFALGCLLFECLAGEPAFRGDHFMSVLAKVLFDEPPRLSDVRGDVPEALATLCARMLSKDPETRPRDGRSAAEALRAFQEGGGDLAEVVAPGAEAGAVTGRPAALTAMERRPVAVLLVGVVGTGDASIADAATLPGALIAEASAWGGRVESLPGGAAALTMVGQGAATDLARQAARAALALRRQTPDQPMALSLGWSTITGRLPRLGDAIDRAARLISATGPGDPGGALPIAIDDGLAGLLDAQLDVREHEDRFFLVGERASAEGGRTLLGKQTSCVGRDGELGMLAAAFAACVEEPSARAVLVTAPPGVGKSRLGQEFLRRATERAPRASIWMGRGDPRRARSPFGLLADAIKGACGILEGEPLGARQDKLRAQVARRVPEPERRRVAEFVGELVGAPFPDDDSAPLRAARREAQVMSEQMQHAFLALVQAACAEGPVVLVLEDLHWGDLATTRFVDAALRQLAGEPLFVLALARPEVVELFPRLWAERGVHELRLKELGTKACERLARQVLGEDAHRRTINRIVSIADGNAFYLEELIRAAAEGREHELPDTVMAMVQSRLGALDAEARRLLRAASVFGETCWASGVSALVGGPAGAGLAALVDRELLVKRPESRFAREGELAFRHALLREGAYAMLTEEDRALGHRLAGQWLEDHGEGDPLVLAGHFDGGGEHGRAARYWLRAAEIAHRGEDVEAALSHLHQGLAGEVPAEIELALLGMQCELGTWRLDASGPTMLAAERMMREAPPGSQPWAQGVAAALAYANLLGLPDRFEALLGTLVGVEPDSQATGLAAFALFVGLYGTLLEGRVASLGPLVERVRAMLERVEEREPFGAGFLHVALAMEHLLAREEPWSALLRVDAAQKSYRGADHVRGASGARLVRGLVLWTLGATRRAEEELLGVAGADETYGGWCSYRPFVLVHLASERGDLDAARRLAEGLVASGRARALARDEGCGRWLLGEVLCRAGDLERAERELDAAVPLLAVSTGIDLPGVQAARAAVRLQQGRAAEALAVAEDGVARSRAMEGACGFFRGARLRLVHAECLAAAGQGNAAGKALAAARERLLDIAGRIPEPQYRTSFLEEVPENRRTLALAQEWLGEAAGR
ncbi:serine/threonine-protein kinase [Sorangium sp. So ce1000]|uniref:serine/threonine-protein kinase n=1 Tax=Sorangium sp. So ce1000 TaxID=3133325 RepID=UPI003F5FDB51